MMCPTASLLSSERGNSLAKLDLSTGATLCAANTEVGFKIISIIYF